MLTAAANTTYTIELFASPGGAPGQGETFLGSLTVATAPNGFVSFVFTSSLPATAGSFITATATDPNNNTSALSAPLTLGGNANNLFVASAYGLLLGRAPDTGRRWLGQCIEQRGLGRRRLTRHRRRHGISNGPGVCPLWPILESGTRRPGRAGLA